LLARVDSGVDLVLEDQERRQRALRLDDSLPDVLGNFENPYGREIGVLRFSRIDIGECRVSGAEIDTDVHC
jgi:hypothetical protein